MVRSIGDICDTHRVELELTYEGGGKERLECPVCRREWFEGIRQIQELSFPRVVPVPPLKPDQREYLDSLFERIRASRVFDPKTVIGGR